MHKKKKFECPEKRLHMILRIFVFFCFFLNNRHLTATRHAFLPSRGTNSVNRLQLWYWTNPEAHQGGTGFNCGSSHVLMRVQKLTVAPCRCRLSFPAPVVLSRINMIWKGCWEICELQIWTITDRCITQERSLWENIVRKLNLLLNLEFSLGEMYLSWIWDNHWFGIHV